MADEKQVKFSTLIRCGHCQNSAPMKIVGSHSQAEQCEDERFSMSWEEGWFYELLECPACKAMTLRRDYYNSEIPEEADPQQLYPSETKILLGLPKAIHSAYETAERIRSMDSNSYGVLIRRLLELVCQDRKAEGKNLHEKLLWLSKQNEIPGKLADAAMGIKNFGNIGAHASLGELTPAEVPVLHDLSRAVLEYIYTLPSLVTKAQLQIKNLKSSSKSKTGK